MTRKRGDGVKPAAWLDPWALPPGEVTCRFLGCDKPAATWVVPPYQAGTGWCRSHARDVIDAATVGYASGTSCEHRPMSEVRALAVNNT